MPCFVLNVCFVNFLCPLSVDVAGVHCFFGCFLSFEYFIDVPWCSFFMPLQCTEGWCAVLLQKFTFCAGFLGVQYFIDVPWNSLFVPLQ